MNTALVGYTGFVGGNLAASHAFTGLYNSKNITQAFGTKPDLLIYAGVPAAKYLANKAPNEDLAQIQNAFENICKIAPRRLVLISTVDVYETPQNVDENTPLNLQNPAAYGRNRAILEDMVRKQYPAALIVRLPALFGTGLKKNFLYDYLTLVPAMLTQEKYAQLAAQSPLVQSSYTSAANGFYKLNTLTPQAGAALRTWYENSSFNALSFTDNRAVFQYYDLSWLWKDISWALAANLTTLNMATQPVSAAEIYDMLTNGQKFENITAKAPVPYDMRSKYDALYEGANGYLYSREEVLDAVRAFVCAMRK